MEKSLKLVFHILPSKYAPPHTVLPNWTCRDLGISNDEEMVQPVLVSGNQISEVFVQPESNPVFQHPPVIRKAEIKSNQFSVSIIAISQWTHHGQKVQYEIFNFTPVL